MGKITLRKYQVESRDAINEYLLSGRGSNPLVVVPTAGGKSIIIASYIQETIAQFGSVRVLMLTHQKELIEQNAEKLVSIYPEGDIGIYSAGIGRKDTDNQILFAGIQSIYKHADKIGHVDAVIVDECHMIPKKSGGTYRTFLDNLRDINPNIKIIGFSATPYRLQGGYLYEGKDALFDGISYEVAVKTLLKDGFITPLTTNTVKTKFDLSNVSMSKSTYDYKESELHKAVDTPELVESACKEIVLNSKDRHSIMVFASGVDHAEHISQELNRLGIHSKVITGSTSKKQREQMLADFKAMEFKAIVNVGVLTTGFDAPNVDVIAMLRPTQSTSLYIQMLGRGVRLFDGKDNCLVLDFADNIITHGPFDCPKVQDSTPASQKGLAPTRECVECHKIVAAQVPMCPFCGFVFPRAEREVHHNTTAANIDILSTDTNTQFVAVSETRFALHSKPQKPKSIRVEYLNGGLVVAKEWVCPNHGAGARDKALRFWSAMMPNMMPMEIELAIEMLNTNAAHKIKSIEITTRSKHASVISRSFEEYQSAI